MYAVIETGGKQYRVQEGDVVFIEKLSVSEGEDFTFDKVLAVSKDGEFLTGDSVNGASVSAKVLGQGKQKKIIVFKYKPKKVTAESKDTDSHTPRYRSKRLTHN